MTISDSIEFTYAGAPAEMYVLRDGGFCWGRIVTADLQQLDVNSDTDHYDDDDEDAVAAFIEEAKAGNVEPAIREI